MIRLLVETIEGDRYPFSPRIRILAKFGELGPQPPTPEERDPARRPRTQRPRR
jgi:hypothetical protein